MGLKNTFGPRHFLALHMESIAPDSFSFTFSYVVVQWGFHTSSHLISQCCGSFLELLKSDLKAPFTRPFPKRCPPSVRARSPRSVTVSNCPPVIFSQLLLKQVRQGVMKIFDLPGFLSSHVRPSVSLSLSGCLPAEDIPAQCRTVLSLIFPPSCHSLNSELK